MHKSYDKYVAKIRKEIIDLRKVSLDLRENLKSGDFYC